MDPTDTQAACFEVGVKFGSLYHQFAGTPVDPGSAPSLERAMEEAIENQPACEWVSVSIDTEEIARELADRSVDYTELTGRYLDVEIAVEHEGVAVDAAMSMEGKYPLMRVTDVRP